MEVIVDEILLVILLPHAGSMQCYVKQAANSAACGALRLVHWFSCRININQSGNAKTAKWEYSKQTQHFLTFLQLSGTGEAGLLLFDNYILMQ